MQILLGELYALSVLWLLTQRFFDTDLPLDYYEVTTDFGTTANIYFELTRSTIKSNPRTSC